MCGFVGIFGGKGAEPAVLRERALQMSRKLRHRGPDWSGVFACAQAVLAHERLAIVDPISGGQPLYSPDRKQVLAVNGEIYNHRTLRKRFEGRYAYRTESDCEVILSLYRDKGPHFLEDLNGIFAFALYDAETGAYLIARDHMGIIPLYMGWDGYGNVYVASELKALVRSMPADKGVSSGPLLVQPRGRRTAPLVRARLVCL